MALKKYSQKYVREVKTRHRTGSNGPETDRLQEFPTCKPKLCLWEPSDSKHGGKLFCQGEITGEPEYVAFEKHYDRNGKELPPPASWVPELRTVWKHLKERNFHKSGVYFPERIKDWNYFFGSQVPWDGLGAVPKDKLPKFALCRPAPKEVGVDRQEAAGREVLQQAGLDGDGRLRLFYKDGKDVACTSPSR